MQWRIPELANPAEVAGVIGQWYVNLEAGLYRSGGARVPYAFGDDDGLEAALRRAAPSTLRFTVVRR